MSNLLEKASILTTPTAYDNGSLHSVKPVPAFGPELITNGDFATDSDWDKLNATINNGRATVNVVNGAYSYVNQNESFTSGKKYKLVAQIKGLSGSSGKQIRIRDNSSNSGGLTTVNGTVTLNESLQNIELYWRANSNSIQIIIERNTSSGDYSFEIDNVSVKEVTDADFDFTRGSAATRVNSQGLVENVQILSGNLVQNGDFSEIGSELITNGGFDTDSNWVKGNGWSISNGLAVSSESAQSISQVFNIEEGKTYKVSFEIKNYQSGKVKAQFGGGTPVQGIFNSSNGVYTEYFTAIQGNNRLNFKGQGSDVFTGSIDNVSVKEVGQNWTFSGDNFSIVDGALRINRVTNTTYIQQNVLTSGKKYKVEFDVLDKVDNNGTFIVRLGSNNVYDVSTYEGTRFSKILTSSGIDFRIYSSSDNGVIYVDNVSVIEITDDTDLPRIDYTSGTGSLLLEPQSTNLVTYSEDFSQWTNTGSETTDTANALISPSGLLNATKLQEANSNFGYHRLSKSITASSNTDYSLSFFAKKGTISYVQLLLINTNNSDASSKVFDLENGVVGETVLYNGTLSDSKIEDFGNGWYRCSIVAQLPTTPNTFRINLANAATGNTTNLGMVQYTGNSNGNIYIWGAQYEALSYATSYIPTSGSSVTRNADVCINAGSSDLINSTEGVLYAEISAFDNTIALNRKIMLGDGSFNNGVEFSFQTTTNRMQFIIRSGGTISMNIETTAFDVTEFNKIAIHYKSNEGKVFVNGNQISVTDTSVVSPIGLNRLDLKFSTAFEFEGNVKCIAVFKEALTDEELTCLTS